MTSEAADAVYAEMQATDIFAGIRLADFDVALEQGGIEYIGQDTIEALYENIKAQSVRPGLCKTAGLKLVYSPLNGSGLVPVTRVLGDIGITDITIVPEQQYPDGNFPLARIPTPRFVRRWPWALRWRKNPAQKYDTCRRPGRRPRGHCRAL